MKAYPLIRDAVGCSVVTAAIINQRIPELAARSRALALAVGRVPLPRLLGSPGFPLPTVTTSALASCAPPVIIITHYLMTDAS